MIQHRFSKEINREFHGTLKKRVGAYFKDNKIRKGANYQMILKSCFALSLYLIPYFIMILSGISNPFILLLLWICMGLGVATIGTSVMHDALHGSYSKRKDVNFLLSFSAMVIGVNARVWKIQHNVLHHTFTNIEHADEDIDPRFVLRFTPHQTRRWFHYYQHIYAPIFYSISTLIWVTAKDFVKLFQYRKKGLVKKTEFLGFLIEMTGYKLLYHFVFLVLPMLLLNIPFWLTLLMFVGMHLVTGILISLIFQTAHIMPDCRFINTQDVLIEENWAVHQIFTTTNYAMTNRTFSWFFGGLNYQIEHHLFPNICHVHYPQISKIVRDTTAEYNLPYYAQKSFRSAIINHFQMLKNLGRCDNP